MNLDLLNPKLIALAAAVILVIAGVAWLHCAKAQKYDCSFAENIWP